MTVVLIRERQREIETQRRRPRADRGRDWNDTATGKGQWQPTKAEEAKKDSP